MKIIEQKINNREGKTIMCKSDDQFRKKCTETKKAIQQLKRRIKYIEGQMQIRQAYVVYWSNKASAFMVVNANSHECFETALRHIHLLKELNDSRDNLINKLNETEL